MNRFSTILGTGVAIIGVAGCGGASGGAASTTTVTQTVTVTATADSTNGSNDTAVASDPSVAEVTPAVTDFAITPKVLSKKCFGSAGCIIKFRVTPVYSGEPLPDSQQTEVTYEVVGSTDPYTNTFTMTGTMASVQQEESVDTPTDRDITIKVTDVSVLG